MSKKKSSKKKTLKDAKFHVRSVGKFKHMNKKDVEIVLVGNGWFPWDSIENLIGRDIRLVVKK